jgi:UrcA family protein
MNTITQPAGLRSMTVTVLFSTLALSMAAMCRADDRGGEPQSIVKYADLNVSSYAGAAALYARISAAAGGVCRALDGRDLERKTHFARCVQQAISDAVTQVDQPALSAIYNAKNSNSKPLLLAARVSQ